MRRLAKAECILSFWKCPSATTVYASRQCTLLFDTARSQLFCADADCKSILASGDLQTCEVARSFEMYSIHLLCLNLILAIRAI